MADIMKKTPFLVSLKSMIAKMEVPSDEHHAYLDKNTGDLSPFAKRKFWKVRGGLLLLTDCLGILSLEELI